MCFLLLLIIRIIYFLNRLKPTRKPINTFVAVGTWSDDGKIASGSGLGTCIASNGNVWVAGYLLKMIN